VLFSYKASKTIRPEKLRHDGKKFLFNELEPVAEGDVVLQVSVEDRRPAEPEP